MESREQMAAWAAAATERPSTVGVTTGEGPYLDNTAKLLCTIDVQAVDLAQSVEELLGTLSTKMDDISSCSREYSRLYDNLVSGTEQSIDLAVRMPCLDHAPLVFGRPDIVRPAAQTTQMGCLIMKCQCLDVSLGSVDSMAGEILEIKQTLSQLEKAVAKMPRPKN
eukprot:COSAG05_NODE_162_length_15499_cov_23.006104_5_plen_166_part_00